MRPDSILRPHLIFSPMTAEPTATASRSPLQTVQMILTSETTLYILKRILQALLTLLLASAFSFFIIQLAPGDFLSAYRNTPEITPETIQQFEEQFGLNKPIWQQYFQWLYQVIFKFNFVS